MGPHYPFDNGPHGLNTLVSSHWMTSNGLLVMLDPNTAFLHVGFNAPRQNRHEGFVQRSWGTCTCLCLLAASYPREAGVCCSTM